jgi:DNA-binding response OmpR family regulator
MENQLQIGIVEDEHIFAESLRAELEASGFLVPHISSNYDTAVSNILASPPHLLLLDIQLMGNKTGLDVAEHINNTCRIPFVFITANRDEKTTARMNALKPLAVLTKPLDVSTLIGHVSNILYEAS